MLLLENTGSANEVGAPEAPPAWRDAIAHLRADEFALREESTRALEHLPPSALPWLEAQRRSRGAGGDPDYLLRIEGAIRAISRRQAHSDLRRGRQLSIARKGVKPEEVLSEIDASSPRGLVGRQVGDIWTDPGAADFAAAGSYWEVVDQMFRTFPPDAAAEPGREGLQDDRDMTRLDESDLAAIGQAQTVTGAVHLRVARTAVERSRGGDYLSFTLIPKLEPDYLPDQVSLLVEGVRFADGSVLAPEDGVRRVARSTAYRPELAYQAARDLTWSIPLDGSPDNTAPVKIDGQVQVATRRMRWVERELPPGAEEVAITGAISLELDLQAPEITLTFCGTENPRLDFSQFSRKGRRFQFELLDAEGSVVEMGLRRGRSSGTAGDWTCSYTFDIGEAEPAAVRVLVPGEAMRARLPFVIDKVSLPGSR